MSAVDLQILQHHDLKCEMETRQSNKEECEELGKELIENSEFVDIVNEKLDQVCDKNKI